MLKIVNQKVGQAGNLVVFNLENNDTVAMTWKEFDSLLDSGDDSIVFDGLIHQYTAVMQDKEYSDDPNEILGFNKV